MAKEKPSRLKAQLPRGFIDRNAEDFRTTALLLEKIRSVYELYGFDPVETPMFEYTEYLGKFLPDEDRPNAGVFSLTDDDDAWLSLRYDLTAPLARYVAENFERLPKPYRSYRAGYVFRNEKPGPGRYRQFMQFDADTVGAPHVSADAEIAMMAADTLDCLGIERGDYVIRVNNRKLLDGILHIIGIDGEENAERRLTAMRAMDKLDRLGKKGVEELLGNGRLDESGDFTDGAKLPASAIMAILDFISAGEDHTSSTLSTLQTLVSESPSGLQGLEELQEMAHLFQSSGYASDRILIDPSVVRGLEYYTGPVYEAELTFDTTDDGGNAIRFGSVGGGGRYDGLVSRFRAEPVPATGFSIGVSRLANALQTLGKLPETGIRGPVLVLVMDRDQIGRYQSMVTTLRSKGIRAELYQGGSGMKAQMKYADRRNSPCVIIQGSEERDQGIIQIKDLDEGKRLSQNIEDNQTWRESHPAQFTVAEEKLVEAVSTIVSQIS